MRIVTNSPDRLMLEEKPWLLGVIIAAAILIFVMMALLMLGDSIWMGLAMFLGAGLFGAAFVVFVRRVVVIFDRSAGAVVIRSVGVLGQSEQTLALADIAGVEVETTISTSTQSGRRSSSKTHRATLLTRQGKVPLTEVYSGGNGAADAAQAVKGWLGLQ